jgi:hypothetical protein
MNKFKKEMISRSWSSSIRFLFEAKENDDEVGALELYENYATWCGINRERVKTSAKFFQDIKTNIEKKRTKKGMEYDLATITI